MSSVSHFIKTVTAFFNNKVNKEVWSCVTQNEVEGMPVMGTGVNITWWSPNEKHVKSILMSL